MPLTSLPYRTQVTQSLTESDSRPLRRIRVHGQALFQPTRCCCGSPLAANLKTLTMSPTFQTVFQCVTSESRFNRIHKNVTVCTYRPSQAHASCKWDFRVFSLLPL